MLERALDRGHLSARGMNRVLRVSWTLADLAGRSEPSEHEMAEAIGLRLRRERAA
jgi:magnesium chelatase family protein